MLWRQIMMIMKISNDTDQIVLAVLGMAIGSMFLHLHLRKNFFSCSSSRSVKHHQIGRSVCQSGRFFLSSLLPISQVSFRVSINLHFFPLTSFAFGFALVPFLTNVSHIDDRLMRVSSCAEKSPKVQLMNSWCKARSDLFKSAGLDLRCQAS